MTKSPVAAVSMLAVKATADSCTNRARDSAQMACESMSSCESTPAMAAERDGAIWLRSSARDVVWPLVRA